MNKVITLLLIFLLLASSQLKAQPLVQFAIKNLSTLLIDGSSYDDAIVNIKYFDPDFMHYRYYYIGGHDVGTPTGRGALYFFNEDGSPGPLFAMSRFKNGYFSHYAKNKLGERVSVFTPFILNTKAKSKDDEPEWYYPDENTGAIPFTYYQHLYMRPKNKEVLFHRLYKLGDPQNFILYNRAKLNGKELRLKPFNADFGDCIEGDCINTPKGEKAKLKIDDLGILWTRFKDGIAQENAQLQLETYELIYVEIEQGLPVKTYTRILPPNESISYVDLIKKDKRYFVKNASCLEGNCVNGTGALYFAIEDLGIEGVFYGEFEKNHIVKGTLHTLDGMIIDGNFGTLPYSGEFTVQAFNQTIPLQFENGTLMPSEHQLGKGNVYQQLRTAYGIKKLKESLPNKGHKVFSEESIILTRNNYKLAYETPKLEPGKVYTINLLNGDSDIDVFFEIKAKESVFYSDIKKDVYRNKTKNGFHSYPLQVDEAQSIVVELELKRDFLLKKYSNKPHYLPVYVLISERDVTQ